VSVPTFRDRDTAELARIKSFRRQLSHVFKPLRFTLLKQAENNQRIAHACGTCRMGSDPQTSVINADGRAHGLTNLYIADASFFPSSGGTNPGLTIAANALRVADRIGTSGLIDLAGGQTAVGGQQNDSVSCAS